MSLFDEIAGKLAGSAAGGSGGRLYAMWKCCSSQQGGHPAWRRHSSKKGLGDVVSSLDRHRPESAGLRRPDPAGARGGASSNSCPEVGDASTDAAGSQLADLLPRHAWTSLPQGGQTRSRCGPHRLLGRDSCRPDVRTAARNPGRLLYQKLGAWRPCCHWRRRWGWGCWPVPGFTRLCLSLVCWCASIGSLSPPPGSMGRCWRTLGF